MEIHKPVKLLSIECKDIASAMKISENTDGYCIRTRDGGLNLKKFINTLDYSLELIKLREVYEKATRRKNFSYTIGKHEYITAVINLKFNYSYKEYNECGRNVYIKAGYDIRSCIFVDNACVLNGELIAIRTDSHVDQALPKDILGKCFKFVGDRYIQVGSIPTIMNCEELRRWVYANGFVCDGNQYVRFARSAGSSRVGDCLFILGSMSKAMEKYSLCGLKIDKGDEVDLASLEAYKALTLSSIIDTVEIRPNEILLIDDYDSEFEECVAAVSEVNGSLSVEKRIAKIKNSIWDGQGLADVSLFGKYAHKGMMVLRNRMFKCCAFNTNISKFFEDNGITKVSQLNGITLATEVSDIKLIVTPSSVKYLKFGNKTDKMFLKWLENIDSTFGLVKTEKGTKYFNNRLVSTHYQLLSTLELSKEDVGELLNPSLEYLEALRSDPSVLRYHLGMIAEDGEPPLTFSCPIKTRNDIVFKMLGINSQFSKTKIYKDFRSKLIKGLVKELKVGHLLMPGTYATICGNPLEMLKSAIGRFFGISYISPLTIHCSKFRDGEDLLGTRSPHIVASNILLTTNRLNSDIEKYFNFTPEIVCINAINENIQQKLNGCDYDSDTILLTNQRKLISAAQKNYHRFPVPVNLVHAKRTNRCYGVEDKADLDTKTSVNKIGEIVNMSMYLGSIYWDKIASGSTHEELEELYLDTSTLAVLSNIEIDRAKKEIPIDSSRELNKLNKKYRIVENEKTTKPLFFKTIAQKNGFEPNPNINYRHFNIPMDFVHEIVKSANFKQAQKYKHKTIPFIEIIKKPSRDGVGGAMSRQRDRIIEAVRSAQKEINDLYVGFNSKPVTVKSMIKQQAAEIMEWCVSGIGLYDYSEYAMYLALKEIDNEINEQIATTLLEALFSTPSKAFFNMVEDSRDAVSYLEEAQAGDITLYDFKFKKV